MEIVTDTNGDNTCPTPVQRRDRCGTSTGDTVDAGGSVGFNITSPGNVAWGNGQGVAGSLPDDRPTNKGDVMGGGIPVCTVRPNGDPNLPHQRVTVRARSWRTP